MLVVLQKENPARRAASFGQRCFSFRSEVGRLKKGASSALTRIAESVLLNLPVIAKCRSPGTILTAPPRLC